METSRNEKLTVHEAGGLSSPHDYELYLAWKKSFPGYVWTIAEVDRDNGLTLYCEQAGYTIGLHFANANCGYSGTGPRVTVDILVDARFGGREDLERTVFTQMKLSLSK